jgi:hypothetical protein
LKDKWHKERVSYTPQQNGVAKKKNRTIVEMARSMLKTKQLGNEFWVEAVHTIVYTLNICITRIFLDDSGGSMVRVQTQCFTYVNIWMHL